MKTKLDRCLLGRFLCYDDVDGIYDFFVKNLTSGNWRCQGQITSRNFKYVENNATPFAKYETV